MLRLDGLETIDGGAAAPGTLLLSGWRSSRMAYFVVTLNGQPALLPLANMGDRPFTVVPVAPGIGTFMAVHGAQLAVDIEKMQTSSESDVRPGMAFVAGTEAGLIARLNYGTVFIRHDGTVLPSFDWSTAMVFEGWRFEVEDTEGKQAVLVDSRLGLRY